MSLSASIIKVRSKIRHLDARLVFAGLLVWESSIYWLDEFTGPVSFYAPFYVFPVAFSAIFLGRLSTFFFVLLSSMARAQVFSQGFQHGNIWMAGFDVAQSVLLYGSIAFLVMTIQDMYDRLLRYADYLRGNIRQMRQQRRYKASIRRALPEDAEDIVRLAVVGANRGGLSEDLTNTLLQRTMASAFRQGIIDGRTVRQVWAGGLQSVPVEYWVSVINGRIAGFFMLYAVDDKHGTERELHAMVVADEYLGMGIGAAMSDFFCQHFTNRRLFAACKPGTKMMKMLIRRGFSVYCPTQNDYVIIERHN